MGCTYVKDFFPEKKEKPAFKKGGKVSCACGGETHMKKGGKARAKSSKAKSSSKLNKKESAMAAQLVQQIVGQAAQTGRMPGVPQSRSRGVPVASSEPLIK